MARKLQPIESDARYGEAVTILRTLENGLVENENEADALRIEDHLERQPRGLRPNNRNKLPSRSRADYLSDRLQKHRATTPAKKAAEPAVGTLPETVATALEIIRGARPPLRADRKTQIEQLEKDHAVIREAIFAQRPIVDQLRDELIGQQSAQDREAWRAIQLRKFRALQAVAAIRDEEMDFRKSRIDAGYTPWRGDLLPEMAARPMLVLGSERDWDSEISRMRVALEKEKSL